MSETTSLQEVLNPSHLSRDFETVCSIFKYGGCDLRGAVYERLLHGEGSDCCVLDVGCASGGALKQLIAGLGMTAGHMHLGKQVKGIGVDLVIPSCEGDVDGASVDLRQGSATLLPVSDNSVDVLYSSNTLIYVADVLRAFEEGYRVLKVNGVAFWDICMRDISASPLFCQILEATPGASDVFKYFPTVGKRGFVLCKKGSDSQFKGFPYQLLRELSDKDVDVEDLSTDPESVAYHARLIRYYKNAVYEAISPNEI